MSEEMAERLLAVLERIAVQLEQRRQFYTSLTHWNNHLYRNINHRQATSVTHGAARNVGGES